MTIQSTCKRTTCCIAGLVTVLTCLIRMTATAEIVTGGLQLHLDAASPGGDTANTWAALVGDDATLAAYGTGNKPIYVSVGDVKFYRFSAVDMNNGGYARVPTNPLADDADITNGFTIEVWVRANSTNAFQVLGGFDKADQAGDNNQLGVRVSTSDQDASEVDYVAYHVSTSDSFSRTRIIDDQPLVTNEWEHIVLTYDGANYTGYKNGSPHLTTAFTVSLAGIDAFNIGAKASNGTQLHQFLSGDIAQLRVYDAPLSLAQVRQNYKSGDVFASDTVQEGAVTNGLRVYLDGRTSHNTDTLWVNRVGSAAPDASGTDTTLVTDDPSGVDHYSFNGSSSSAIIDVNPLDGQTDVEDSFTVEVWLRPQADATFQVLAGFDCTGSVTDQMGLRIGDDNPATGTYDYYGYRFEDVNGFGRYKVVDEDPSIPLDEWVQIILVWQQTSPGTGAFTGYRNGYKQIEATGIPFDFAVADFEQFRVGTKTTSAGSPHFFLDGDVSIVRVYDDVLTWHEIWKNFAHDAPYHGVFVPPLGSLFRIW